MATANVNTDIKSYECSLCLDIFQDPRLLPCGHTVCGPESTEKCIENLDSKQNGEIRCPECQADHKLVVAQLPPDDEARDLLVSLNATKPKKSCLEHGKELVLRCVTDGKEICVDCFMNEHSGHQIEGIHKKEQNRLYGFWKSHKTELEVMQLKCKQRIDKTEQEVECLQNQLLKERALIKSMEILIAINDVLTTKLESNDFDLDDENILALKVFMDQLEATSDSQVEASQEVRKHNQDAMQLVDSRAATSCNSLPFEAASHTMNPIRRTQSEVASSSKRTESSVENRASFVSSRSQLMTNILALGSEGMHYSLRLSDNTWQQWEGKRTDFTLVYGAVCFKQKVYVIGAYRSDEFKIDPTADVDIYSLRENKWTDGPKLKTARCLMTCCVLKSNRTIYVCGGCRSSFVENMSDDSVVKTVEKLELDKNGDPVGEWTLVKPMKDKRLGAAAVAVGNRVFVTGGINKEAGPLSSVEVYDITNGNWSYGPPMNQSRFFHQSLHYQSKIFVMGGTMDAVNGMSSCEKFDLVRWTWTAVESMRMPRTFFGSVVTNDKLYVIGGDTNGSEEDDKSVEVYDIASNTWSTGPAVPEKLYFTRCVSC